MIWIALLATMATTGAIDPRIGLYRGAGGQRLIVFALDSARLAIGFGDGEVRGLAGSGPVFVYGPSIGSAEPQQGRVEFAAEAGPVERVTWTPQGQTAIVAIRVRLAEREVEFVNRDVRLSGTVIVPVGGKASRAVVFVAGSGVETRESSRALGYHFADSGIASLIFDKRASGRSGGTTVDVPFGDLADDVLAGVALLRREPGVAPTGVGLLGTSQGTWVALEATRRDSLLAFVILVSGGGTSPLEAEMYRGEQTLRRATKLTDAEIAAAVQFRRHKFEYAISDSGRDAYEAEAAKARTSVWFKHIGDRLPNQAFWRPNGRFDPIPFLQSFHRPVLAIFGALDANNDATHNVAAIAAAWQRNGNPANRVTRFEHANHGLFETDVALPVEQQLPQLSRLVPGYLALLTQWIQSVPQ